MHLFLCLDDHNGLLFNHRRQSQDRLLRRTLLTLAGDRPLWMSSYSAQQFEPEYHSRLLVDDDFLSKAGPDALCFSEAGGLSPFQDRIQSLSLFRWNRTYPADVFLDLSLENWILTETHDFPGFSHEKITLEVYTK